MIDVVRTSDFDHWRQAVSSTFVPLDAVSPGDGSFHAEMRGTSLGALRLYRVTATRHRVRRTSRLIAGSPADFFKLGLAIDGTSVVAQDGREALLRPGDFAVYDTTRPYTFSHDGPCRLLVLIFPRALLGLPCQDVGTLTATRFSGGSGLGGLVSSFLCRAADVLDTEEVRDDHRLGATVLDLLATGLAGRLDVRPSDPDAARRTLVTRAEAFITAHLGSPSLSPDEVAAALHISTRYLHKLFHASGTTVSARIRRLRLEACRQEIMASSRPVSAIGARWGLTDAAHFSRLFRDAYGLSPREYRALALGPGDMGASAH